MAFMAKNRSLSYCKVVEVIAETTAPLTSMGELLKKIPSQREEIYPIKVMSDGIHFCGSCALIHGNINLLY